MHLLTEKNIAIQRPSSDVFGFIANMENFGMWFPGVLSIVSSNNKAHGDIGKQYQETVHIPLRGNQNINITVKDSVASEFFATEGLFAPLYPRMEIRLTATNDLSCNVSWSMYSRNKSAAFRLLMLPLIKKVMHQRAAIGVERLRELLEKPSLA